MLINQAQVKKFALDYAKSHRNHKFTRVSKEFLTRIDVSLIKTIEYEIQTHPSKGRTIK